MITISSKLYKTLLAVAFAVPLWTALPGVQTGISVAADSNIASDRAHIGSSVAVVRPAFPIRLNGLQLDTQHSRYPFLFYNDITYMPLTWNNMQALGMETRWNSSDGLLIRNYRNSPPPLRLEPPEQDLLTQPDNAKSHSARVAQGPIQLNGIEIDNATEPYPFLSFRDVVYMPLTWRFTRDILQIDLRWENDGGLALVGGQHMFGNIIGDDETYLYIRSNWLDNPDKALIRMAKTDYAVSWGNREELQALTERIREAQAADPHRGQPAELTRRDRVLSYGDTWLYTLSDQDVMTYENWGTTLHTYTQYDAGEQGTIVSLNFRIQVPLASYDAGKTLHFLVRPDGQAVPLEALNQNLASVIPNADGSVWLITETRKTRFGEAIAGTAQLGMLQPSGEFVLVNDLFSRSDIVVLGHTNPLLDSPTSADGSLHVLILEAKRDISADSELPIGLYTLTTGIQPQLLTPHVDYRKTPTSLFPLVVRPFYMDSAGSLYVQHPNNTIENWTTGDVRSWLDYELAQSDK